VIVIRPVQQTDLDALVALASTAGYGLTTLPHDPELLRKRIAKSLRSFRDMGDTPAGEAYLLVAEETETGRVIGTSGIVSKVGGFQPFYAYRLETSVHESAILGVHKEIQTLHLVAEHNGPSEIGSLFLAPERRRDGSGRVLSLARFLFMAQRPECFDPVVVAELRGVIDEGGHSPFWDALGRHFFDVELPKADYLCMVDKRFIADLMPTHPIYVPLLPEAAQRVIGEVHEQTKPARRLVEAEGFRFASMVDIFDAGPVLTCRLSEIRTVRESRVAKVSSIVDRELGSQACLIASASPEFRACQGAVEMTGSGGAVVSGSVAAALKIRERDVIRFAPLRAAGGGA
jgi:arginine N-succinyltransferase